MTQTDFPQGDHRPSLSYNAASIRPRNGVITLFGYGTSVCVDRGHLIIEDGIGHERRHGRFPRVGHGLKRLVVIGSDGMVSFAALRWLADQNASFVMLERDGSVLATTGPVRPSDARLRRAQSAACDTATGIKLATELINQKLSGQEKVARERLNNLSGCRQHRQTSNHSSVSSAARIHPLH